MGIDLRLIVAMGLTGFIAYWLISGTANPMQTSRRLSRRRWLRFARIAGVVFLLSGFSSMFMTVGSFAEAYQNSVLLALLVIVPLFMLHGARSLLRELRRKTAIHNAVKPYEEPSPAGDVSETREDDAYALTDSARIPEFAVPGFAIDAADDASLASFSEQAVETEAEALKQAVEAEAVERAVDAAAEEQAAEAEAVERAFDAAAGEQAVEAEAVERAVDAAAGEQAAEAEAVERAVDAAEEAAPTHADMTEIQDAKTAAAYPGMLETDVLALNEEDAVDDIDDQLDRMSELMETHDLGDEPEPFGGGEAKDNGKASDNTEEHNKPGPLLKTQRSGLETALTALHQDNQRLQKLLIAQQSALDIERKLHEGTRQAERHAVKLAQRAVSSRAVAIKRLRQESVARQRLAMRTRDAAVALQNAVSMLDAEKVRHTALKESYAKVTEEA